METTFDVIVVGLGAMGSAAAYHLARQGRRVLGLDRFSPPHALGSSHGQTRIIREAYFEDPRYVPLVQRAYELWTALEREAERRLLLETGGLMIGRPDSTVVRGARRSAETHGLRHELLAAAEVRRRFPALRPDDDMVAVWEPRAGILIPEACVAAHLAMARRHGATLRVDEPVLRWEPDGGGVRVASAQGVYAAGQLVLSAGSWLTSLLPDLALPLTVERQPLYWFEACRNAASFTPERLPIHLWEHAPQRYLYGFPDLGDGVKVARHHEGRLTDPDAVDREVHAEEVEAMRGLVRRYVPDADGPLRSAAVCLYTNTPDDHFLIDRHPAHEQVVVASPCSGHGFKFASAIGEALAELLSEGRTRLDLSLFEQRFG
ncbi:MAG: N-methyl-L-tryptophan oxidase [Candidatus Eisenbacteria bacterium]|uniref:N-methyl-L-tryptophan oxidase n=1 Tax=Eiseniibacteriota bacterium TaxID=2212470 RepID=A0A538UDY9_UNCEI|nr:MAG: N-methyl-L-tryptophan oxidase [Candidatus Eisenbacteria bacterium]